MLILFSLLFLFSDPTPTGIYTLSLHDALPICLAEILADAILLGGVTNDRRDTDDLARLGTRSEEHTSELQSHSDLVCRLLLEKKNQLLIFQLRGCDVLEHLAKSGLFHPFHREC